MFFVGVGQRDDRLEPRCFAPQPESPIGADEHEMVGIGSDDVEGSSVDGLGDRTQDTVTGGTGGVEAAHPLSRDGPGGVEGGRGGGDDVDREASIDELERDDRRLALGVGHFQVTVDPGTRAVVVGADAEPPQCVIDADVGRRGVFESSPRATIVGELVAGEVGAVAKDRASVDETQPAAGRRRAAGFGATANRGQLTPPCVFENAIAGEGQRAVPDGDEGGNRVDRQRAVRRPPNRERRAIGRRQLALRRRVGPSPCPAPQSGHLCVESRRIRRIARGRTGGAEAMPGIVVGPRIHAVVGRRSANDGQIGRQ